jgi:hypothetical protein
MGGRGLCLGAGKTRSQKKSLKMPSFQPISCPILDTAIYCWAALAYTQRLPFKITTIKKLKPLRQFSNFLRSRIANWLKHYFAFW